MKHARQTHHKIFQDIQFISTLADNPSSLNATTLGKLIHDLQSAANAFAFTVEAMSLDANKQSQERKLAKLRQLRQHARLNQECVQMVCSSLAKIRPCMNQK